jgi:cytochrome c551/c552
VPRLMSWTVGFFAAALQITAADAQGNIDAGKTPAQIFGDTCSACHRNARELRRASASFLRAHYTTGSDEAAAMASYLAGLGDGRASQPSQAAQPKRPPGEAKQAARAPVEQPKSERPGPAAAQPKRPATNVSTTAQARVIAEERHVDPPPAPTPPAPVLVPFEE